MGSMRKFATVVAHVRDSLPKEALRGKNVPLGETGMPETPPRPPKQAAEKPGV